MKGDFMNDIVISINGVDISLSEGMELLVIFDQSGEISVLVDEISEVME
jgi:hypothetical protein